MGHLQVPFRKAPFVRPTVCYILGLIASSFVTIHIQYVYVSLVILIFILTISLLRSQIYIFSCTLLLISFCIGYIHLQSLQLQLGSKSYTTLIHSNLTYKATVSANPFTNANRDKIKIPIRIDSVVYMHDSIQSSLFVQLNVIAFFDAELFSLSDMTIGDNILLSGRLEEIRTNPNPHSFDYKQYLSNKGINYLFYATEFKMANKKSKSIKGIFQDLQQRFVSILNENIKDKDAANIAAAMVLGHKDNLSQDIKTIYRKTGSAHIIAVSGLHIDIIAYLLLILLGKNRISNRYLKSVQYISLIILIWSYALLVGSSASVIRASLMFSFYLLAQMTSRQTNIWNILSVTALIMLVYNPRYIYDISFQFSFIGVISIVYFFPKLKFLNAFKNRILKWWIDALLVSIVVQVLIAPISIYYFNYFPIGFILSNSVMIFFMYVIMIGSIGVILSYFIMQPMTYYLASILEKSITGLNSFLRIIYTISYDEFENIYLSPTQLCIIYGYIGLLILLFNNVTLTRIKLFCFIVACHLGYSQYINRSISYPAIIAYHCPNNNLIDFIYKDICYSYSTNGRQYSFHTEGNRLVNGAYDIRYLCDDYYQDKYIRKSGHAIEFFEHKLLIEYEGQYENINEFDLILAKPNYTPLLDTIEHIVLNTKTDNTSTFGHNSYVDGPFIHLLK